MEEKELDAAGLNSERNDLGINPDALFDEKFAAVMVDMLEGRHISQADTKDSGLFGQPEDNNEDDPTNDF